MDFEEFKKNVSNVGLNFPFFHFNERDEKGHLIFKFPIKQVRSLNNSMTQPFYKHISRTITLENNESDKTV